MWIWKGVGGCTSVAIIIMHACSLFMFLLYWTTPSKRAASRVCRCVGLAFD